MMLVSSLIPSNFLALAVIFLLLTFWIVPSNATDICPGSCENTEAEATVAYFRCFGAVYRGPLPFKSEEWKEARRQCFSRLQRAVTFNTVRCTGGLDTEEFNRRLNRLKKAAKRSIKSNIPERFFRSMLQTALCPRTRPPTPSPTANPTVCQEQYVIDFETTGTGIELNKGDMIDETVLFNGVTFKARRRQDEEFDIFNAAMIFDTRTVSGGDTDLASLPANGNVLIISENFDADEPDDNRFGGQIVAEFNQPVTVKSIELLDIDSNGGTVEIFDEDDAILMNVAIRAGGNARAFTLMLNAMQVKTMVITLIKSGALDSLVIERECPTDAPTLSPVDDDGMTSLFF